MDTLHIKTLFAFLLAIFIKLVGKIDDWLLWCIILMGIDYLTGIMAAFINQELSSSVGLRGIIKKMMTFCVIILANAVDSLLFLNGVLRIVIIAFILSNEGLSILENCAESGVKVPNKLKEALKQIRDRNS